MRAGGEHEIDAVASDIGGEAACSAVAVGPSSQHVAQHGDAPPVRPCGSAAPRISKAARIEAGLAL